MKVEPYTSRRERLDLAARAEEAASLWMPRTGVRSVLVQGRRYFLYMNHLICVRAALLREESPQSARWIFTMKQGRHFKGFRQRRMCADLVIMVGFYPGWGGAMFLMSRDQIGARTGIAITRRAHTDHGGYCKSTLAFVRKLRMLIGKAP